VRLVGGRRAVGSFDASHPQQSTLDIDCDGVADALTDGLLVIRYLFGLRGAALIRGAVGAGAQRNLATALRKFATQADPKVREKVRAMPPRNAGRSKA